MYSYKKEYSTYSWFRFLTKKSPYSYNCIRKHFQGSKSLTFDRCIFEKLRQEHFLTLPEVVTKVYIKWSIKQGLKVTNMNLLRSLTLRKETHLGANDVVSWCLWLLSPIESYLLVPTLPLSRLSIPFSKAVLGALGFEKVISIHLWMKKKKEDL